MLLSVAWIVLALECVASVLFGYLFWRFWSQATIDTHVRTVAMVIYSIGCIAILAFAFTLPL